MKSNKFKNSVKNTVIVLVSITVGFSVQGLFSPAGNHDHEKSVEQKKQKEDIWTCSMHPQIRLPKPGKCPICSMDLIKLEDNNGSRDLGKSVISISPYAAKLIEVETSKVERKFIESKIRMMGKVDYDETKISYVSAWIPGRLDKLFVNYTGIAVNKGDHLAQIYSPELLSAQEELLQAIKLQHKLKASSSEILKSTANSTVKASREKLRLFGLTKQQIDQVVESKVVKDHITIYSPSNGIVIHKNIQEGSYVKTGTRIYTVVDLSTVWVKLDAYESDLQWLKYGSHVEFTTEAYPGKIFTGTVSFIAPTINPNTRTAKIRVNVNNKQLQLKPGMFVRATLKSKISADGSLVDQSLMGKWIGPMHPEIIKDSPGVCDICEIPLISSEQLGYASKEEAIAPLVIPATAVLKTGKRAVVYISLPNKKSPTYEGRVISLGSRLGDYYIVNSGLKVGDSVVTRGAFSLDAELQIQAKPSMMLPSESKNKMVMDKKTTQIITAPEQFKKQLREVLTRYYAVQQALTIDDTQAVTANAKLIYPTLKKVQMELLKGEAHMVWMNQLKGLNKALNLLTAATELKGQREAFQLTSSQVLKVVKTFLSEDNKIYQASCPMAFNNKGGTWLQGTNKLSNPYLGQAMLTCGDIKPLTPQKKGASGE